MQARCCSHSRRICTPVSLIVGARSMSTLIEMDTGLEDRQVFRYLWHEEITSNNMSLRRLR